MERAPIVVVSGLPRSGTSMMMQMLAAGGEPILSDGRRAPDDDNPRGYLEYEPVKALASGARWIAAARGKALKVVSALLAHLPDDETYRIIFMKRPIDEVLASQRAMLARAGRTPAPDRDARLRELFLRHLEEVDTWLRSRPSITSVEIHYGEAVSAADRVAGRVNRFLGGHLDVERMAACVSSNLHRQRVTTTSNSLR
jgi:hypothetical protein